MDSDWKEIEFELPPQWQGEFSSMGKAIVKTVSENPLTVDISQIWFPWRIPRWWKLWSRFRFWRWKRKLNTEGYEIVVKIVDDIFSIEVVALDG